MLDFDLAEIYGVETRVLKQAVRRNMERFPKDFMFEISKEEFEVLRSQSVISSTHGGTRYMPFAFTEQGVAMLSSVFEKQIGHCREHFNNESLCDDSEVCAFT